MIEHKQLYRHKPEQGLIGDCFRTCIACLLNCKSPEDVPHYYAEFWPAGKLEADIADLVNRETNKWLHANFNLNFIEFPLKCSDNESMFKWASAYFPPGFSFTVGCSSKNGGHSVICKPHGYIWDPAIDNSGMVGPMEDGHYWIGLLCPSL